MVLRHRFYFHLPYLDLPRRSCDEGVHRFPDLDGGADDMHCLSV